MYLIIGKKAFYLSLSKQAVRAKCKKAGARAESIITCSSYSEAVACIKAFRIGKTFLPEVVFDRLTYWPTERVVSLADLETGVGYRFRSGGMVEMRTTDGKIYRYKNCPSGIIDSKKTVVLLRKRENLLFYDFEKDCVITVTADKKCVEK
ncbi:hypothetical protein [Clostridium transplantifaecale]|uniref:hypothetical protein n=1 Tax=Clostridium transplantifaecale TaxID=2479838 RepID=UPI000F638AFC|nr:hypothetical protein [Clostridium transplantifaecale]